MLHLYPDYQLNFLVKVDRIQYRVSCEKHEVRTGGKVVAG